MTAADKIAEARALIEPLTGHTPGPWHFHGPIKGRKMWCLELDSDTNFVADLWRPNVDANAALIAAAPDLRDTVATLADLADAQAQEIALLRDALKDIEKADFTACPFDSPDCQVKPDEPCPVCGDQNTWGQISQCKSMGASAAARAALGETP